MPLASYPLPPDASRALCSRPHPLLSRGLTLRRGRRGPATQAISFGHWSCLFHKEAAETEELSVPWAPPRVCRSV